MKDNKTMKYLLGVALLGIWGLLAFRLYHRYYANDELMIPIDYAPAQDELLRQDSFAILANYRDPFLGNKLQQPRISSNTAEDSRFNRRPSRSNRTLKKQPLVFPKIDYKGTVALKNGTEAALVTIDHQFMNWRKGERYQGLSLKKIYPDSILVSYKGVEKTILKMR